METFGQRLRRLREEADLSQARLAALVPISQSSLSRYEADRQAVDDPRVADRLDELLNAGGSLVAVRPLTAEEVALTPDDRARVAYSAAHPSRTDHATIDSLAAVLAASRRLEDTVGSAAMLEPTQGHLRLVERLTRDACGPLRPGVVSLAAQVAQFAGWLHSATGRFVAGRRLYDRAAEWALEVGDTDMVATTLSMKGWVAWQVGQLGPMMGLSAAAGRDNNASRGVRALAAQQEARAHALLGDASATDRRLDEATELALSVDEDREPPWVYFYGPDYLAMQRGRAYRYLGRYNEAAELIEAGLSALPVEARGADWAKSYQADLAAVRAAL